MNPASKINVLTFHILLFIVILTWGILLQSSEGRALGANYAYNQGYGALYFIGGLMGLLGARYLTTSVAMGKALLHLGVAQMSYVTGIVLWVFLNRVFHVTFPNSPLADVFIALFYIFLAVGCWNILLTVVTNVRVRHVVEALVIFSVSAIIIISFFNIPNVSSSLTAQTKIFHIIFQLGDGLLIALSYLIFRTCRDKFKSGLFILTLGLFLQVCSDVMYFYRINASLYWNGDVSDILYAVSGFVLSLSIITLFFDFVADHAAKTQFVGDSVAAGAREGDTANQTPK